MKCEDIYELISLYIDRQLDRENEKKLFEHIENCEECKRLFDDLTGIIQNLEDIPLEELPEDYHSELMSKIDECSSNTEKSYNKNKISWKKYTSIAAGFLMVVAVSGVIGNSLGNNRNIAMEESVPQPAIADGLSVTPADAPPETEAEGINENAERSLKSTMASPDAAYSEDSAEESEVLLESADTIKISERKKIKTLDISVETKNFDEMIEKIKSETESLGGYVEYYSSSIYNTRYDTGTEFKEGNMTLRVPQEKYDFLKEIIASESKVKSQTENTDDVTSQYIDTQSKLKVKKIEEERLLKLLNETSTIEEIIKIEERLSDVRSYIEGYAASIENWDKLVSFSTVNLNILQVEEQKLSSVDPDFLSKIKDSFINSINSVVIFFENIVVAVAGNFIPALIIVVLLTVIFLALKIIIKKRRKK